MFGPLKNREGVELGGWEGWGGVERILLGFAPDESSDCDKDSSRLQQKSRKYETRND